MFTGWKSIAASVALGLFPVLSAACAAGAGFLAETALPVDPE